MEEKRKVKVLAIEDDPFCVAVYKHYGEKMRKLFLDVHHTVTLEESLSFLDGQPDIDDGNGNDG